MKLRSVHSAIRHSREFIDSLDRSVLGSFASDDRVLHITDTIYRIGKAYGGVPNIPGNSRYYALADELVSLVGVGSEKMKHVNAELMFWWMKHDSEQKLIRYYNFQHRNEVDQSEVQRIYNLGLVCEFPEMHEYFKVDIWDTELIKRFMADDVDAELASKALGIHA